jgi:hypothetical protein
MAAVAGDIFPGLGVRYIMWSPTLKKLVGCTLE